LFGYSASELLSFGLVTQYLRLSAV